MIIMTLPFDKCLLKVGIKYGKEIDTRIEITKRRI